MFADLPIGRSHCVSGTSAVNFGKLICLRVVLHKIITIILALHEWASITSHSTCRIQLDSIYRPWSTGYINQVCFGSFLGSKSFLKAIFCNYIRRYQFEQKWKQASCAASSLKNIYYIDQLHLPFFTSSSSHLIETENAMLFHRENSLQKRNMPTILFLCRVVVSHSLILLIYNDRQTIQFINTCCLKTN